MKKFKVKKTIPLKGITAQPSDYLSEDGQLMAAIDLIPENASLNVRRPYQHILDILEDDTGTDDTIVAVHETTDGQTNFIFYNSKTRVYGFYSATSDPSKPNREESAGPLDKANSIDTMGNMVILLYDNGMTYLIWKDGKYHTFNIDDFQYDVELWEEKAEITWDTKTGELLRIKSMLIPSASLPGYDVRSPLLTVAETVKLWNLYDSNLAVLATQKNGGDTFRYISFGVAALRLYDGSHILVSDIFTIAPPQMPPKSFWVYTDKVEMDSDSSPYVMRYGWMGRETKAQRRGNFTNSGKDQLYTVKASVQLSTYRTVMEDVVSGVDIFLTLPQDFVDLTKAANFVVNARDIYTPDCCFTFPAVEKKDWIDYITSLPFYKSESFSTADGEKYLKPVKGTEQTISLADFRRKGYGGKGAFVFNNRLHIYHTFDDITDPRSGTATFRGLFPSDGEKDFDALPETRLDDDGTPMVNDEGTYLTTDQPCLIGQLADNVSVGHDIYQNDVAMRVVFGNSDDKYYRLTWQEAEAMLFQPIIMFPDADAKRIYFYFHHTQDDEYEERSIGLTASDHIGCAMAIRWQERTYTFFKEEDESRKETWYLPSFDIRYEGYHVTNHQTGFDDYSGGTIHKEDYEDALAKADAQTVNDDTPNQVRLSEAANPLVFPAANSITAGKKRILALATAAKPMSQGQYGQYPLYIFATDGIWAAHATDTGTYAYVRPLSFDVLAETALQSITPVDGGVVFATRRGLLMLQGQAITPLTDIIDGEQWFFRKETDNPPFLPQVQNLNKAGGALIPALEQFKDFRDFLETAGTAFDYQNQRLLLYNGDSRWIDEGYNVAFTFSLDSKQWGMTCEPIIYSPDRAHQYYVRDANGGEYKALYRLNDEPTATDASTRPVLAITRPIKLGEPDTHKTIHSVAIRGRFPVSPDNAQGCRLATVLWGSNDLVNWHLVSSSQNHLLRNRAGTPYKYFCVAVAGILRHSDTLAAVTIDYDLRDDNKSR